MKLLLALGLTTFLITGCTDSSTQTAPNESSDTGSQGDTNSGSGDGTSSGDQGSQAGTDTDSSGDSDSGEATVEPEPTAPSNPTLLTFYGTDFKYPAVLINQVQTADPRDSYVQRAPDYIAAQAAIEAKHALSFYPTVAILSRDNYQLETIVSKCPSGGEDFEQARCEFHVKLAYDKTMAQDGWQNETFPRGSDATVCVLGSACYFLLSGTGSYSDGVSAQSTDYMMKTTLPTHKISPIEGWAYIKASDKVRPMNTAIAKHAICAGINYSEWVSAGGPGAWYVSFWPQYHFTIWHVTADVYRDVWRDISASSKDTPDCNAQLRRDLEAIHGDYLF